MPESQVSLKKNAPVLGLPSQAASGLSVVPNPTSKGTLPPVAVPSKGSLPPVPAYITVPSHLAPRRKSGISSRAALFFLFAFILGVVCLISMIVGGSDDNDGNEFKVVTKDRVRDETSSGHCVDGKCDFTDDTSSDVMRECIMTDMGCGCIETINGKETLHPCPGPCGCNVGAGGGSLGSRYESADYDARNPDRDMSIPPTPRVPPAYGVPSGTYDRNYQVPRTPDLPSLEAYRGWNW